MGFGDKLKDLRKQAQEAVAENSEKIHTALDAAAVAANEKTGGKHAQRIVKFGEKASGAVDKFGAGEGEPASEPAQPSAEAAPGPEPTVPAGEPEAPTAPPSAGPPPPSPSPAANPDLAAWAAGDDSAANQ
ncbi:MAG TPA: Rv0909 family putative TA system antitoxin [Solirubrobacteraceae bacterium]|nr:Rv0909 family putative TA system antitoxin [Solirubrobacteraceae bacterium]